MDEPTRDLTILPPAESRLPALVPPPMIEAESDDQLIDLWLHGRARRTRLAYGADACAFMTRVAKPLRLVTLNDLQAYQDSLAPLATASQARRLSSVKSLLSFGQKTGYLTLNVGAAIFLPKIKNTLAERILSEDEVLTMLALERNPRNKVMLRLLYLGGLRISEICDLRVRDMAPREDAGQTARPGRCCSRPRSGRNW